jgi:hypothetical protein
MPGWASVMPLRRLLVEHAATQGTSNSLQARISSSLAFADKLSSLDTRYFANHPKLAKRLERLKGQNPNYVAHEYFNRESNPFYFMDVAEELSEAKLTWIGPANALENLDELNLTKEQREFLSGIDNIALRQTHGTTSSTSNSGATSSSKGPFACLRMPCAKSGSICGLPCRPTAPRSPTRHRACAIRSSCKALSTIH